MNFSIIIPFYNRWELVHARMYEIYKYLPDNIEIILADDCSTDDPAEISGGVGWWQKKSGLKNVRYMRNENNLGFGGNFNRASKLAKNDVLVFLSNDVVISGNFIAELELVDYSKSLIGQRLIDWRAGWNEVDKFVIPYLEGFFLACSKEVWQIIGGFDPIYGKYDYEDVDLSLRALQLGYGLKTISSHYLKHLGGQTISGLKSNRLEHTIKNQQIFIEKWSNQLPLIFGEQA